MSFTPGATNSPATATDGIVGKGQLANNETIAVTRLLTNADRRVQVLTPSGAAQIVQLPTTSIVAGEAWDILCASGAAFALTVQSSNGTTLSTLNAGESLRYVTKVATPVASTDWSILSPSLSLADGSVTTPAVRFTGSSVDTGIYSPGVDQIAFSNGGAQTLLVSATGAHTVGPTASNVVHTLSGEALISDLTATSNKNVLVLKDATTRLNGGVYGILFRDSSDQANARIYATHNSAANNSAGLTIQVASGAGGASPDVTAIDILNSGAVTLGPASATNALTVNGKQIHLAVNNTTADTYISYGNSSEIQGYVGTQGTTGTAFAGKTISQSVTAGDLMLATQGSGRGIVFATSAGSTLNVVGRFAGTGGLSLLANAAVGLSLKRTDASGAGPFTMQDFVDGAGDVCGRIQIDASANTASYVTSSDARLKTNVRSFDALAMVAAVSPSLYDRHSGSVNEYGFMAQSLADVLPQAVSAGSIAGPAEEGFEAWGIDYGKLTPILWKAVQELKAELETAKARIAVLETP